MSIFSHIVTDEQWVMKELAKAEHLLHTVGHTAAVDIVTLDKWLQAHHKDIIVLMQGALEALAIVGVPFGGAPEIAAAEAALELATTAVHNLSGSVLAGSTPLPVARAAYHAVVDAGTAVNAVKKLATSRVHPASLVQPPARPTIASNAGQPPGAMSVVPPPSEHGKSAEAPGHNKEEK